MIALEKVTVHQGEFCLRDIDLEIPVGAYAILMGPTGCGKTTLLESICGLRRITSGRIMIDGRDVSRLAPSARRIGYVPQEAVLFPTMRIDSQIGFGLEMRRTSKANRAKRVAELARLLEIEELLERYPRGLSGGERQRVALARALAFKPSLLCLDEPLSALDDATRGRLVELLRTVHRKENATVLQITHNAAEAEQLGTVIHQLDGLKIMTIDNLPLN